MAYPTASTPVSTSFATTATSMGVAMPTVVANGSLLIALVESRYAETWTVPTGWTLLFSQAGGAAVGQLSAFYRTSNGSESGTTVTWTCNTATTAAWQVIEVTGAIGATAPVYTLASGDSTTNPSSPALTPSWGSAATLWLAVVGDAATGSAFTSAPAGYTGFTNTGLAAGGADAELATATLQATASSETPGVWGYGSNRYWAAATIGIKPQTVIVNETMASAPTTGTFVTNTTGLGWNSAGYFTTNNNVNQYGDIQYSGTLVTPLTAQATIQMTNTSGADAQWFYYGSSTTPQTEADTTGIGYIFSREEFSNHIRIRFGGSVIAEYALSNDTTFDTFQVNITGSNPYVLQIIYKGSVVGVYTDSARTLPGNLYGWGSRSGGTANTHNFQNLLLTDSSAPTPPPATTSTGRFFAFF